MKHRYGRFMLPYWLDFAKLNWLCYDSKQKQLHVWGLMSGTSFLVGTDAIDATESSVNISLMSENPEFSEWLSDFDKKAAKVRPQILSRLTSLQPDEGVDVQTDIACETNITKISQTSSQES